VTTAALLAAGAWVAYALAGPRLARRLRPATAARAMALAALLVALSSVVVLAAVAATWIGQLPELGRLGWWSTAALRAESPIPRVPAMGCAVLVCLALANLARTAWRRIRVLMGLSRCCRDLHAVDGVILLESDRLDAFTTTPPNARIVVTTGLLHRLSTDEGRALFAHERSHLAHRHGWWILAADLAAALNPLLAPTGTAVRRAVERWADEDAARAVGDRGLVARSLARTALLVNAVPSVPVAAASGGDVGERVRAMLGPPPRTRPLPAAVLTAMLLLAVVASGTVPYDADLLFDRAGLSASAPR
jgi:Zn-dependent protease with chaperone function